MIQSTKPIPHQIDETPTPGFLKRLENASFEAAKKLLDIPDRPKSERIAKLSKRQLDELQRIEEAAIADFQGDLSQLEAALGMLRMGHHFGWKVLYVIHSKKTVRTYEEILNIRIRDIFPENGPGSYRSFGFQLAQKFSNFWKVAGGDIKIPRRRDTSN